MVSGWGMWVVPPEVSAWLVEAMAFADPPLGIAVKIHDGNFRALRPVCVEVLRQLGEALFFR